MSDIRFSVIIVCRHGADSLGRTLQALGELEYSQPLEVIVIDDGSEQGREKAVIVAGNRGLPVRYLRAPGARSASAWNLGLRESCGQFVAFLDDDCTPPPGWLNAYESAFDGWVVGAAGGPDRVPPDSSAFSKALEYVLTSFIGTLGMRTGFRRLVGYYPRPWNMAARREAVLLAGGFDELAAEAPEVPMLSKLERIGYRTAYQPDAWVWHRRETTMQRFISRDFRLGMERARGESQPGLGRVYGALSLLIIALLVLMGRSGTHAMSLGFLGLLTKAYLLGILLSGVHAAARTGVPATMVLVPFLLVGHHASHLAGYMMGFTSKKLSRR